MEYDTLDLAEFVSGYLEFCKAQQKASKASLLHHLPLLMDHAVTYSSPRVRNFTCLLTTLWSTVIQLGKVSTSSVSDLKLSFHVTIFVPTSHHHAALAWCNSPVINPKIIFVRSGITLANVAAPLLMFLTSPLIAVVFVTGSIMPCWCVPNANIPFHPFPWFHLLILSLTRQPDYPP